MLCYGVSCCWCQVSKTLFYFKRHLENIIFALNRSVLGSIYAMTSLVILRPMLLFLIKCVCLSFTALFEKAEVQSDETKPNHLIIAISSDRGLCGGIHSGVSKAAKALIAKKGDGIDTKIIICGDKAKTILQRTHCMLNVNCYL